MKEVIGEKIKGGSWRFQFPTPIGINKGESIRIRYDMLHPERIFFRKNGKLLTLLVYLKDYLLRRIRGA